MEKRDMNAEKRNGKRKMRDMKKATILGLSALILIGLVFSINIISAYRGDYSVKGPNCNEERHEAMEDAFESLDYGGWKELMTESGKHPGVVDVVTESNFETFVNAHEAGENGDYETAAQLRAELGLNNGKGPRDGTGHDQMDGAGHGRGMGQCKGQRMQRKTFADGLCDEDCDPPESRQGRGRR